MKGLNWLWIIAIIVVGYILLKDHAPQTAASVDNTVARLLSSASSVTQSAVPQAGGQTSTEQPPGQFPSNLRVLIRNNSTDPNKCPIQVTDEHGSKVSLGPGMEAWILVPIMTKPNGSHYISFQYLSETYTYYCTGKPLMIPFN